MPDDKDPLVDLLREPREELTGGDFLDELQNTLELKYNHVKKST